MKDLYELYDEKQPDSVCTEKEEDSSLGIVGILVCIVIFFFFSSLMSNFNTEPTPPGKVF